jgi:LL-diaminopimelate aminotransferase
VRSTEGSVRSKRLRDLPAYLFEELAKTRRQREAEGVDVIDLSIGDPDLGAPQGVVDALAEFAADRRLHRYTPHWAVEEFNRAVAGWMGRRFSVKLDPATEILPLIGSKEGIAHLPLAVMDPDDLALVPDPGYPVYSRGVWFAGGRVEWIPLLEEHGFLPSPDSIKAHRARLIYLNYPNNPTSAVADLDFYRRVVDTARRSGAFIANDAAYSEIAFDGYSAPSILKVPGAKEVAVEFHSFSKSFSMAGWRVGFVAGSADVVDALGTLKSNIDSGVFGALLLSAARALSGGWEDHARVMKEYDERRRLILEGLEASGLEWHRSPATLYIWGKVPGGGSSLEFARLLLEHAGVLVTPGVGFGSAGEGYFRLSVTCPTERIRSAATRLPEVCRLWKT